MNSKVALWICCFLLSIHAVKDVRAETDNVQNPAVLRTLTVNSSNPGTGAAVSIDKIDVYSLSSGTTPFIRTYNTLTYIKLTAPLMAGGHYFQKWQKNGVDWTQDNATSLVVDANYTITAVYQSTYNAAGFSFSVTSPSPYSTVPTGSTMTCQWTASGWSFMYYDVGCFVEIFVLDKTSGAFNSLNKSSSYFYPANSASGTFNWTVNRPPGTYCLVGKFITYNGLEWTVAILRWGYSNDFTVTDAQASQKHALQVYSQSPASGVDIAVSPNDANGYGDGTAYFSRTYIHNTPVTLTAPSTIGTRTFLKWQLGGTDYSNDKSITFVMNADKTFTAVFSPQSGNKYRYNARKLSGAQNAPVIDGNLSDSAWSGTEEAVLGRGGTGDAFFSPWSSFTDNRVTWKAVWCEETNKLYAAIQVIDDVRGAADNDFDSASYQPWLDDSIELYTDGDHDGGPYSCETAQQWRITTRNKKNLYNYPVEGTHSYSGGECITAVQSGTGGNWTCEVEMAVYDYFNGSRKILHEGDVMGWDVWYNDSDNRTLNGGYYVRDCQTGWWYTGPAWANADYFGDLELGGSTGVESGRRVPVPGGITLFQNYPNPFNSVTAISFALPTDRRVTVKVYGMTGREAAALVDGDMKAGMHRVEWNAASFGSGVYFLKMQAGDFTAARKLVLLR
jgi:hypothetical protein